MANAHVSSLSSIQLPLSIEDFVVYDAGMNAIYEIRLDINDLILGKIRPAALDILERLVTLKEEILDLQLEIITNLTIDPRLLTMCSPDPVGFDGEEFLAKEVQRDIHGRLLSYRDSLGNVINVKYCGLNYASVRLTGMIDGDSVSNTRVYSTGTYACPVMVSLITDDTIINFDPDMGLEFHRRVTSSWGEVQFDGWAAIRNLPVALIHDPYRGLWILSTGPGTGRPLNGEEILQAIQALGSEWSDALRQQLTAAVQATQQA